MSSRSFAGFRSRWFPRRFRREYLVHKQHHHLHQAQVYRLELYSQSATVSALTRMHLNLEAPPDDLYSELLFASKSTGTEVACSTSNPNGLCTNFSTSLSRDSKQKCGSTVGSSRHLSSVGGFAQTSLWHISASCPNSQRSKQSKSAVHEGCSWGALFVNEL